MRDVDGAGIVHVDVRAGKRDFGESFVFRAAGRKHLRLDGEVKRTVVGDEREDGVARRLGEAFHAAQHVGFDSVRSRQRVDPGDGAGVFGRGTV